MKRLTQVAGFSAAVALVAVLPAAAQTSMMRMAPAAMAVSTPEFVKMAAQSDEFEITEGKLAEKAGTPELQKFGAMMVRDHTKTTEGLQAALKTAGMDAPPPPMTAEQKAMVEKLRGLTGKTFDRAFLEQAVASHKKALALHEAYDKAGDSKPIVAASKQATPIVKAHLQMAERMAAGKPGDM